jgi:hypothetical protein
MLEEFFTSYLAVTKQQRIMNPERYLTHFIHKCEWRLFTNVNAGGIFH